MKYSDILFDLDGTLFDSAPGIKSSLRHSVLAVCPDAAELIDRIAIGPPIRVMVANAKPDIRPEVLEEIALAFRQHYDTVGWRDTVVYAGVTALLEHLSSNDIGLYVATNKPARITDLMVKYFDLDRYFRSVHSVDVDVAEFSTKEALVGHIMRENRLTRYSTLFVGDGEGDAKAAKDNGLDFVWASYGYCGPEAIAEFPSVLHTDSLPQLLTWFERTGRAIDA